MHAEYFAEMVRQAVYERYQDDTYTKGFRVYTTLSKAHQEAAYQSVRRGVQEYDRRHGYRGPEGYADLPARATEEALEDALQDPPTATISLPRSWWRQAPSWSRPTARAEKWVEIGEEG